MASEKITDLAVINEVDLEDADVFVVVDASDTSMAPTGTDKQISKAQLFLWVNASGVLSPSGVSTAVSDIDVSVSGNVTLRGTNGDWSGGSTGGTVLLSSASGNVTVSSTSGNTEVHSTSGNVTLSTTSGTIFLGSGVDIQLAATGDINIVGPRIGFFGAAAVTQPLTPVTLGDVIALLQSLGLSA